MDCKTKGNQLTTSGPARDKPNWRHLGALALFCVAMFFVGLGSYGFIDRADAYYSEGAREMLESGKYLIPKLNYVTFYDKPILMYWFQILSYCVFGVNEFAARFSTACFATALVFATYFFGKKIGNENTGLRAALILGSSPMYIGLAKQALVDMTFSALLVGSLYCMFLKLSGAKRWIGAVAYLLLALAALTKGPLALVLFAAVISPYVIAVCKNRAGFFDYLRKLDIAIGLLILLVVAAPWYVFAAQETQGFWTDVFFIKGNLSRMSGSVGHSRPQLWFYLPILLYGFFPWIFFLPESIYRFASAVKRNWKADLSLSIPAFHARTFLWCSFLAMLIVVSLPKSKLQTYILPMLPAMSLLVSFTINDCLCDWKEKPTISRYIKLLSILFAVFGVVLIAAGVFFAALFGQPELNAILPAGFGSKLLAISTIGNCEMTIILVASAIICGGGLIWQSVRMAKNLLPLALNILVGCTVGFAVAASHAGFWMAYRLTGADLHKTIKCLEPRTDAEVAFFEEFKPSAMFYLKRPTCMFDQPRQLVDAGPEAKLYIVAKKDKFPRLLKRGSGVTEILDQNGDWLVMQKTGVKLNKLRTLDEVLTKGNQTLNVEMLTLPLTGGVKTPVTPEQK